MSGRADTMEVLWAIVLATDVDGNTPLEGRCPIDG